MTTHVVPCSNKDWANVRVGDKLVDDKGIEHPNLVAINGGYCDWFNEKFTINSFNWLTGTWDQTSLSVDESKAFASLISKITG
jgi:hypothetical protein